MSRRSPKPITIIVTELEVLIIHEGTYHSAMAILICLGGVLRLIELSLLFIKRHAHEHGDRDNGLLPKVGANAFCHDTDIDL